MYARVMEDADEKDEKASEEIISYNAMQIAILSITTYIPCRYGRTARDVTSPKKSDEAIPT